MFFSSLIEIWNKRPPFLIGLDLSLSHKWPLYTGVTVFCLSFLIPKLIFWCLTTVFLAIICYFWIRFSWVINYVIFKSNYFTTFEIQYKLGGIGFFLNTCLPFSPRFVIRGKSSKWKRIILATCYISSTNATSHFSKDFFHIMIDLEVMVWKKNLISFPNLTLR